MMNRLAGAFAVLFLCLSGAGGTQDSPAPVSTVAAPQTSEQAKAPQSDARSDAEQLFQLASGLKAAVDKSNENVLSLDVVRRAEAVEKLAHALRQKIKDHPTGAPKP
jgi:hypothetical protein